MKTTFLLSLLICVPAVTPSLVHWGHHNEDVIRIFKGWGPFEKGGSTPEGYQVICEAEGSFKAKEYRAPDLHVHPPQGLLPWAPAVDAFIRNHEYPGHWKGEDSEGVKREYLVMEYADVPKAVRDWIEKHHRRGFGDHRKWFFAVLAKPKGDEQITDTIAPRTDGSTERRGREQRRRRHAECGDPKG